MKPLFPESWTWPVVIDNDVRLGTYGEWALGAAKGSKFVFGIFPGTGVGGGLVLDGKLYHGFNGHAGEIGHIIIDWKKGVELEAVAGRRNLMNRAKRSLTTLRNRFASHGRESIPHRSRVRKSPSTSNAATRS